MKQQSQAQLPPVPPMSQPSHYSQEQRRPRTDRYQPML
jgi:hypothetical protein